jgi:hypothetical protein
MSEIAYKNEVRLPAGTSLTPKRYLAVNTDFPRDLTIEQALDYLELECAALKNGRLTLGSYYDRLNQRKSRIQMMDHPAVSLELKYNNHDIVFASQQWAKVEQNIYALYLTLRNIFHLSKWGVVSTEQVLLALAEGADTAKASAEQASADPSSAADHGVRADWMVVLGLEFGDTLEHANHQYRQKAKEAANDEERLLELNQAIDKARKYYG